MNLRVALAEQGVMSKIRSSSTSSEMSTEPLAGVEAEIADFIKSVSSRYADGASSMIFGKKTGYMNKQGSKVKK